VSARTHLSLARVGLAHYINLKTPHRPAVALSTAARTFEFYAISNVASPNSQPLKCSFDMPGHNFVGFRTSAFCSEGNRDDLHPMVQICHLAQELLRESRRSLT
jgi:hypothetical protein